MHPCAMASAKKPCGGLSQWAAQMSARASRYAGGWCNSRHRSCAKSQSSRPEPITGPAGCQSIYRASNTNIKPVLLRQRWFLPMPQRRGVA